MRFLLIVIFCDFKTWSKIFFARTFSPLYSNHVTNVYFYLALEYLNFCFSGYVTFFLWFSSTSMMTKLAI